MTVSTARCFPCGHSDPAWRSFTKKTLRLAFPGALVPAATEAQRRLQSWSSQMDLSAGLETGTALSLPSRDRSSSSYHGWEAHAAISSAPIEAQRLQLSDSEDLKMLLVLIQKRLRIRHLRLVLMKSLLRL